jgi:hypothetical protein
MVNWKDSIQPIQAAPAESGATPTGTPAPLAESTGGSWKDSIKPIEAPPSNVGDLLKGISQGATMHFGSNILSGAEAGGKKLMGDEKSLGELYDQYKKANDEAYASAQKRSPVLTGAGEVGGAILPVALTGGLGAPAEGTAALSLGQKALQAAKAGAIYGGINAAGESKNKLLENPTNLAADTASGAALGGATGAILSPAIDTSIGQIKNAAKWAGGKVANVAADSPLLQKLGYTFNQARSGGQTFTGEQAGQEIQDKLRNIAGSVTKQLTQPMQQASDLYGQTLDNATQAGAKLSTDPDLMAKFRAAQATVGSKGGLTDEMNRLLNLHGSQTFDPESVSYVSNALDPRQAKDLQLGLRQLGSSKAYQDTNAISDLDKALTPAINEALPESDLNKVNDIFSKSRQLVEPFINKGVIDPELQAKQVSDIDQDTLNSKINDFISKNIKNMKAGNYQGDQATANINDILDNISNINQKSGINFVDPNQLRSQINDAATTSTIRQGIVGKQAAEGNPLSVSGIGQMLLGSPYRLAQGAGTATKFIGKGVSAGQKLATAGDNVLDSVAQTLKQSGPPGMGESLEKAVQNKSDIAKNAALFSIMQNPNARKAIGINGTGDNNQ